MTGFEDVAGLAARAIAIAEGAAETQKAIVAQQGKSRRNIRLIAVSVVLDVALSAGIGVLAVSQIHVSQQIHASQLQACGIGNDFRARQVRLWDHVLSVSKAPPGETAAERQVRLAKLAEFRSYVAAQFRPVNCTVLYGRP
jgi:hypothetical protein